VLFRELAEGGSAHAQLRLAQMYETGEGVLQSFCGCGALVPRGG